MAPRIKRARERLLRKGLCKTAFFRQNLTEKQYFRQHRLTSFKKNIIIKIYFYELSVGSENRTLVTSKRETRFDLLKEISVLGQIFEEAIIFLSYVLICAALFKSRFSRLATAIAFGAAGIVIAVVQTAITLSGEVTLMFTLLPLTTYLPFSVLLFFLSGSGIFETAAVCSVGTLGVLILKSLQKILMGFTNMNTENPGYVLDIVINAVVALVAAGLVFIAFRFIGKEFRAFVIENKQNRSVRSVGVTLCLPILLIFLMMFYFLNSTTNVITLIFTMLIALSIFFIIAKLLNSEAELMRVKRSENELSEYIDIQRRSYDRVVRKMEAAREYRHDMRHHLAVIEGLAKQDECDKIIEYTSKLNGSFGETQNVIYCKNPEVNAVLSEYISRAESAGCRINRSLALPEMIPFEENDVCLVLANAIDNAINACSELPGEKRYINISAEYDGSHRLLVSVENPCSNTPKFDENGLPVSDKHSDEHGIGLRSVKHIVEKYNGFLRCMPENGEFVFQAVLFYDSGVPGRKSKNTESVPKRAAASLLSLFAGGIIMLNTLPSVAEAASSLFSVNIRTIWSLNRHWGSNSINIDSPEFEGSGAQELNSATKSYTDEAKEKFLWYFNRRYNGYVAEDMKYTVIRDDEKYFVVRFNVTVNAGGSLEYSRWIVFDKSAGKVLELSDLFKDGSDYIGVISTEIREQMIFRNEHEGSAFFVDGSGAFTKIKKDANFYIDSFNRLVIVFDEYEVAPGSMGSPEFFIPNKVLESIAR